MGHPESLEIALQNAYKFSACASSLCCHYGWTKITEAKCHFKGLTQIQLHLQSSVSS